MKNTGRKPVSKLTDRAKRYRANSRGLRPPPPKQCGFCGSGRNVGVHHIEGDESDLDPQNLMWACIWALDAGCGPGPAHQAIQPRQGSERGQGRAAGRNGCLRGRHQSNARRVGRRPWESGFYNSLHSAGHSVCLHRSDLAGAPADLRSVRPRSRIALFRRSSVLRK